VTALPVDGFKVKEDPVSIWISLFVPRVINPVNVLSFAVFLIAPFELIPVPAIVMFSGEVILLEIDNVAPLQTIVAPAVVPRELGLVMLIVPAIILVWPVYVLFADNNKVPESALVMLPAPSPITPLTVMSPAPPKVKPMHH